MEVLPPQTQSHEFTFGPDCDDSLIFSPQHSHPLSRSYSQSHSISSASSIRGPPTPTSGRSSPGFHQHGSIYTPQACFGLTPDPEYSPQYRKDDDDMTKKSYPAPVYQSPPPSEYGRSSIHNGATGPMHFAPLQSLEPIATLLPSSIIHPSHTQSHGPPLTHQWEGSYLYNQPNDHHEWNNANHPDWSGPDAYLGPQPPCEPAQTVFYPEPETTPTIPLNRVQREPKTAQRGRKPTTRPIKFLGREISVKVEEPSRNRCTLCGKTYKRLEHLKRHHVGAHEGIPPIKCPCCDKKTRTGKPDDFNRMDNWRSHLRLHTRKDRPNARTPYHPDAQGYLDREKADRMKRTRGGRIMKKAVKRNAEPATTVRVLQNCPT